MEKVSLADLERIASRRPGLIVGPGATLSRDFFSRLGTALGVPSGTPFPFDDRHLKSANAIEVVRKLLATSAAPPGLAELAQVFWSCVLSLSPDRSLEDTMSDKNQLIANRPPVD